jgi:hypothetical protein
MQGTLLAAAIHPDNTPHGYNLTFAFPMLMFIIIAGALFLRFRGAHNVPGHVALNSSRWAASGTAGTVNVGDATMHASVEPQSTAVEVTTVAGEPAGGASVEPAADEQVQPADEGTEES